jgi:hypothetical protein
LLLMGFMNRVAVLSLVTMGSLAAQSLSIGILGGGAATPAVHDVTSFYPGNSVGTRVWSQSKDWAAGAMVELRFHSGFSLAGVY